MYCSHPGGVECITITEHFGFNIGNAIKYLWRCGLKESTSELDDLKKAAWYIAREIERVGQAEDGPPESGEPNPLTGTSTDQNSGKITLLGQARDIPIFNSQRE